MRAPSDEVAGERQQRTSVELRSDGDAEALFAALVLDRSLEAASDAELLRELSRRGIGRRNEDITDSGLGNIAGGDGGVSGCLGRRDPVRDHRCGHGNTGFDVSDGFGDGLDRGRPSVSTVAVASPWTISCSRRLSVSARETAARSSASIFMVFSEF